VRQRDASIRHFETRVSANTSVEMSSLEQRFDRNERLHSVIILDHVLLAPKPDPILKAVGKLSAGWACGYPDKANGEVGISRFGGLSPFFV
jgi:hypothetical protein